MEVGVSKCKLLCMEWINNKVPPFSTESYIQYPAINHNGNEHIYIHHMCMYEGKLLSPV